MKASELIEALKKMIDAYGDLPVSSTLAVPDGIDGQPVISDDNLLLVYNQFKKDDGTIEDEIGIQNFPY